MMTTCTKATAAHCLITAAIQLAPEESRSASIARLITSRRSIQRPAASRRSPANTLPAITNHETSPKMTQYRGLADEVKKTLEQTNSSISAGSTHHWTRRYNSSVLVLFRRGIIGNFGAFRIF